VFEKVLEAKPREHVDVASTYELSGYLSKIVPTTFIDLRPIKTSLKNLKIKRGDMLHMPFKDRSVRSLSSLHSIEHVGLGRYGGEINPQGTHQACKELSRILAKNGKLYISVPIGKEKVCFNAHRIFSPMTIISFFKDLRLISFSVVDDNSKFIENTRPEKYTNLNYGCGLFIFARQ
jgi:ubiquinone/menaquinone biosynthesis C-methylase UbiE